MNKTPVERLAWIVLKEREESRENVMQFIVDCYDMQGVKFTKEQRTIMAQCMDITKLLEARKKIQETGFYRLNLSKKQQNLL
jgi:hypothetical protein